MSSDFERARALAILGLERSATTDEIRARHRELVRRWHPDRWAHDPAGQDAAATQMRELNWAIEVLRSAPDLPADEVQWPDREDSNAGRDLTADEKAQLVDALGQWNPVAGGIRALPWLIPLFFAYVVSSGHGTGLRYVPPSEGELAMAGVLLVIAVGVLLYQRRE